MEPARVLAGVQALPPIRGRPACEPCAVRFQIEDYKVRTTRLHWDDLDIAGFAERPLDPATLRVLGYMHDIEHHTVCYLRDLLVSPAHADPDIMAFLGFWVFEEFWHGEAIGAVLDAHGIESGAPRIAKLRQRLGWRERVRPVVAALGSAVVGARLLAVHMTWGAINEWTTQAGYLRLAQRSGHPVLAELTRRIAKQEGRHIDFYASQAEQRLAGDRAAQRLVRRALRHVWRPVGSGVMPARETRFVIDHLFGGDDGLVIARRIDRRIDALPGLSGLGLIEGATTGRPIESVTGPPALAA